MTDTVTLTRLQTRLDDELSYPTDRETAAERFGDTTVVFADGDANLGDLIADVPAERFTSTEELFTDLQNVLPIEAVGEPGQSDGDA